ncbi:MAG TPA: thioredoxin family protein, partial [Chitinophagaceae bacterium]|nr:thioredoxin family protein [Chitinophagaceae bacterium]
MKPILYLCSFIFVLNAVCLAQAPALPQAADVVKEACAKAGKENKKVLLIFHASWCGWCKKMEASLDDPACKKMFDDNYVITYLDVMESKGKESLENPGSLDLLKQYKGEKAGLPFWLVLDAHDKPLADSQIRPDGAGLDAPGKNTGCPAEPNEVAHFTSVLKA